MPEYAYDFEKSAQDIFESDNPDIVARLWAVPYDPDMFKRDLSAAGLAYVASIDLTPMIERYRECARFHGRQFDSDGAKAKLRYVAEGVIFGLEDEVFNESHAELRSELIADDTGVSFEQLMFLASKAVSAYRTAVDDYRQMMAIFFQKGYDTESRDHALRRDAIVASDEARAMLRLIVLRDSQVHGYFQETFGDHKQVFALCMRKKMITDIEEALDAQRLVLDWVSVGTDDIELANKKNMDDLADLMKDCLDG